MAYSYLKVKDMDNGQIVNRPIRICSSYSINSNGYIAPMTFDTIFPNLNYPTSGCTISIGLPSKSEYLKAPNQYYGRYIYGIVKKHSYKFFIKNSNDEEVEYPYIFEFGVARGWITQETIQAGVDSPKYYMQACRCVSVFRVKDSNNNDVTQDIFGDRTEFPYRVSPWAPSNSYYPKGWYDLVNLSFTQRIPSYDTSEGSNDSDRCYAFLHDINLIIDVYACYDENTNQHFLTLSSNRDGFLYAYNTSWKRYVNGYAQFNVNGVALELIDWEYFHIMPHRMRTLYFGEGITPVFVSDNDISSGNDNKDGDIKSTSDNGTNYGHGIGEDSTEYIDFPSLTSENPATKSGLYRIVKMNVANLTKLSKFLWSTNPLDTLIKVFSKPFDCIVSLQTLPYNVTADSSTSELKILDYSTDVQVYKNVYTNESVSFGTCECSESFGNFLDYETTKVSIFLPYIGMQPLDVQDVMDAVLTLVYNVDNQTGQCVALLKCTKNNMNVDSVTYSWSGNLSTQLPLTGADNTQYLQGLFNSISSVAIGSTGGVITNSMYPIFNGNKEIIKSGRLDSNTGNLSIMYPFIKIERPIWSRPDNYLDMLGQPYFAEDTLGNLSGYVKVTEVKSELNGVPEESRDRIIELLKDGVYI